MQSISSISYDNNHCATGTSTLSLSLIRIWKNLSFSLTHSWLLTYTEEKECENEMSQLFFLFAFLFLFPHNEKQKINLKKSNKKNWRSKEKSFPKNASKKEKRKNKKKTNFSAFFSYQIKLFNICFNSQKNLLFEFGRQTPWFSFINFDLNSGFRFNYRKRHMAQRFPF